MNQKKIIELTIEYVKKTLENAEKGHDWWHIYRVMNLAKSIGKKEKANLFVVTLGALLHDIADSKFHDGNEEIGPAKAKEFLTSVNVDEKTIEEVVNIIKNISFKGEGHTEAPKSIELCIVQDADRLDAIGAIGIARTFTYGGFKNRQLYDPNEKPKPNMTPEEYKNRNSTTINHFYEKLLLLKNKMNTETGKKIAEHRHKVMEKYLQEFYQEWEGKK
jgi:uncharacterized protein